MAFEVSKLFLCILILVSLLVQTTARRSQMLPSPNNTTNTNDNDNATPTGTNNTGPTLTNDNITPTPTEANDTELTNDNTSPTPINTNDIEPLLTDNYDTPSPAYSTTNDNNHETTTPLSPPQSFADTPYPETTVSQPSQDFFTPDPEYAMSSTPPYYENDVVPSPSPLEPVYPPPYLDLGDYYQNDMSYSPAPVPSYEYSRDDNFSDDTYSPDTTPVTPDTDDVDDYGNESIVPVAAKPTVLPSTYEADDEVDPELAAEMEAYKASQRDSRAMVLVLGCVCLIGVGGFVCKKRKEDLKKSQYQYLNKKDENY